MNRCLALMGCVVAAALVGGCGGGGSEEIGPVVTASIDNAGGTLQARGAGGATLTVEIPSGALARPTEIRIEPLPQEGGSFARYRISPAGLTFLVDATLRLAGAVDVPSRSVLRWRVGDEQFPMRTVQAGSDLQAQVSSMGYALGAAGARAASVGGGRTHRTAAAPSAAAGADASVDLEATVVDCDFELAALELALASAISVSDIVRAQALFDQVEAVLFACRERDIANLKIKACDAYKGAAAAAQAIAADSYQAFRQLVTPLLVTQADLRLVDGACEAPDMDALIEGKFNQFIEFIEADYAKPSFATDFDTARVELRNLFDYQAGCALMELGQTCVRFDTALLPAVLDAMRAASYRECHDNGDLSLLSSMYVEDVRARRIIQRSVRERAAARTESYLNVARFSYDDLEQDMAHCRSTLDVAVFSDAQAIPVEVESQRRQLRGAAVPGAQDTLASITVPRKGSVRLAGPVHTLLCPEGGVSSDEVVARVNGVRLAARGGSSINYALETSPLDLVVSNVLAQAGMDAETTNEFTIDLFREGDACGGRFSSSLKLFSIGVSLNTDVRITTVALPDAAVGATYNATVVASGGQQPYIWGAGGLPAGLMLNASSGAISGTPTEVGSFAVNVSVTTADNVTDRAALTLRVGVTAIPPNWVGTVTYAGNSAFGSTTAAEGYPFTNGSTTYVSSTTKASSQSAVIVSVPVEVALQAIDGSTPALVTMGTSAGSATASNSLETRVEHFETIRPGCMTTERSGYSDAQTGVTRSIVLSNAFDLRVSSDGSYTLHVSGSVAAQGPMTHRSFSFTTNNPQDCAFVLGNFDQTEIRDGGASASGDVPLYLGVITNVRISGSASLSRDLSDPQTGQTGTDTFTVTWDLQPR